MLRYQDPETTMTLREAIAEHHAALGTPLGQDSDSEAAALFAGHDACHAVFGTDTSMVGEATTDTWTMLGTTLPLRRFLGYLRHPEVREAFDHFGFWVAIPGVLRSIPAAWRVWRASRRLHARGDFDGWADHLDEPLDTLRARHGIVVV